MATTTALLIVFFMLASAGFLLFHLSDNARFKRRYFRPFVVLMGAATVGISARDGLWWLGLPLVALLAYRQIKTTRFCDSCGATSWAHARFCANCGARLEE
jgi:hypothetical protein